MTSSRKRPRTLWRVAAALAAAVTAGWEERGEANTLSVTRRDLFLPGWPPDAAGLTLGQLSDMHCDSPAAVARTERAAQMLLAEKPDVVCLTGDFITDQPALWAEPAARALAPLSQAPGGGYAVLGNHDGRCGGAQSTTRYLSDVGFQVLNNRAVPLPTAPDLWMVGLGSLCAREADLPRALKGVPRNAAKILLVHEPDFADLVPTGPDAPRFLLQLSGHSHAGQVRLPGLPPLLCPKWGRRYPEGWQQTPAHPVYTTRGIGLASIKIRLLCPPEVVVLRLFPAA